MYNGTKMMVDILFAVAAEINYGIFRIFVKVFLFKKSEEDYRNIKKIINVKKKKKKQIYLLRDKLESVHISF